MIEYLYNYVGSKGNVLLTQLIKWQNSTYQLGMQKLQTKTRLY